MWTNRVGWVGASALALSLTGCEALLPLAFGTTDPDRDGVAAPTPLVVDLRSVSGTIDGEAIDAERVDARGDFDGVGLFFAFDMELARGSKSLELFVQDAEASTSSPYANGGGCERPEFGAVDELPEGERGSEDPDRDVIAEAADEGQVRGSPVRLLACGLDCVAVQDLELEVIEGPESRELFLDGFWEGSEVHLQLDYVRPE